MSPASFATMPPAFYVVFLFVLGTCIGSFLNVVVWRLPRNESLVTPPSRCPRCEHRLAWYDNLPVVGWIMLAGKCRYCKKPISARYPIIEFITGLLFALLYVALFQWHLGPAINPADLHPLWGFGQLRSIDQDWPIFLLYLVMASGLLAASLIDAELFIIPVEITWLVAALALLIHAVGVDPGSAGSLNPGPAGAALSAGGTVGLILSLALWAAGKMPISFPDGEPILEAEREQVEAQIQEAKRTAKDPADVPKMPPVYSKKQIRAEMGKEMLFLLPPLLLGMVSAVIEMAWPTAGRFWQSAAMSWWAGGLLGSLLGGLVGGLIVWVTRILGTLGFGRVAMGLGDVHLMFAVGAVLGAGSAAVTFFIAPFFGMVLAIYMIITRRHHELPFGPYLSLAALAVLLFYCPIAGYLAPGLLGLAAVVRMVLNLTPVPNG
jgi:leader peptidase (prepilin peptidase)/N-methyltransferase